MRLPPLNALRVFEVFSRTLSVKDTANELNVSQSAVSQQLRNLETHLQRRLIARDGKQLALTEEGDHLAAVAQNMMSRLMEAVDDISENPVPRSFLVSAPPSFTVKWLIPKLKTFRKQHPDLAISIDANAAPVDFENSSFDGAIRFSADPHDDLECVELVCPQIVVVAAPSYVAEHGVLDRLADAASHNLIHCKPPSRRQARLHLDWDDILSTTNADGVSRNLIFPEDHMALSAVVHGHGLGLAERVLVEQELENGSLVVACRETTRSRGSYKFVWPRGAARNSHRMAFLEFLRAELGDTTPPTDAFVTTEI